MISSTRIWLESFVYLDDILIVNRGIGKQHLLKLREVLTRLQGGTTDHQAGQDTSRATVDIPGTRGGTRPSTTQNGNISAILEYPVPTLGSPYGAFWVWQLLPEILSQLRGRYRPSHRLNSGGSWDLQLDGRLQAAFNPN
ncbi:hypothetical protein GWK47_031109 [Chionoecetes opilio]|uniref:Uncharacterized protein n=1 Tax=Chionoecetes opilio TaxID=41210 RepID=A0A8J4YRA0_CHIOP|nr:hypothetical protein GWK47_031109 [Chionoecetes opilio]